jgi:hypothetical protein
MSDALKVEAYDRWDQLDALKKEYSTFQPFLIDCMEDLMGFTCTDIQVDIGDYLQYGPQYLMIQAQRSQAKSSIVAIFSVWCLIHDPKYRILVLSAGSDVAQEIANWIIQIIMNWEILECIRPDRQHGDRASAKAFDIHWHLKGAEKSPSVACIGVTANMQGRRADLLIADDIESTKNGLTEIQRAQLQEKSKDFTSICQNGRIAYLGTPQTTESIYNALPGRGYKVRIWPGRYPTKEQLENYGDHLSPLILKRLTEDSTLQYGGGPLGDQGQPTDPVLLPETALTKKEIDQGPAYFQLQHMLNTRLMDKDRYPLKSRNLVNMDISLDSAPGKVEWLPDTSKIIQIYGLPQKFELYAPYSCSPELFPYEGRMIYVDPAGGGQNGDETVASVTYFLHGYIYLMEQLALTGGFSEEVFKELSQLSLRHKVNKIDVEENFGKGMFAQMWRPILLQTYRDGGHTGCPQIEDIWEAGQKELRIIETLEPVISRHRLIINTEVWRQDVAQVQKYPIDLRSTYSLAHQLSRITRERNALVHDDRVDSLAGAVRPWKEQIAINEDLRIAQKATDENKQFMSEWLEGSPEYRSSHISKLRTQGTGLGRMGVIGQTTKQRRFHARKQRQIQTAALSRRS